jgi:chitodextrinase
VEIISSAIARAVLLAGLMTALAGCAGGATSSAFVDPAKYDLYNCKQLGAARRTTDSRVVELEGLMAKAETGAGGVLVSGLAYQTEYLTARAQRDLIDERIVSNHCTATDLAAPPPEPPAPPVAGRKARR